MHFIPWTITKIKRIKLLPCLFDYILLPHKYKFWNLNEIDIYKSRGKFVNERYSFKRWSKNNRKLIIYEKRSKKPNVLYLKFADD